MKTRALNRSLKRSRSAPVEQSPKDIVRIPIKEATQKNLAALNAEVLRAQQAFEAVTQRLQDSIRSLYTEHGIEAAQPIEVTEKVPYELVVRITKGG